MAHCLIIFISSNTLLRTIYYSEEMGRYAPDREQRHVKQCAHYFTLLRSQLRKSISGKFNLSKI